MKEALSFVRRAALPRTCDVQKICCLDTTARFILRVTLRKGAPRPANGLAPKTTLVKTEATILVGKAGQGIGQVVAPATGRLHQKLKNSCRSADS
jgi:hypothetical protein